MKLTWTGVDGWTSERETEPGIPLTVGRESACDIVVRHARVSRRHARFELHDGHLHVRDLGSRNGTLVNGSRVTEAALVPGDEVGIGPVTMRVATDEEVHQPLAATLVVPAAAPVVAYSPSPPTPSPASPDEDAYRQAAAAGHTGSLNSLGLLMQQRGDAAGAEAEYRRALSAGHAAAGYNLANLLLARGDAAGAQLALRQALDLTNRQVQPGVPAQVARGQTAPSPPPPVVAIARPAPAEWRDQLSSTSHRRHRVRFWAISGGVVLAGMVALLVAANALHPGRLCTRNCPLPPPPHSPPLASPTVYRSSQYGFTVAFDGSLKPSHVTGSLIAWTLHTGQDNFDPIIFGLSAGGRSATTLVKQAAAANFSQFSLQYRIPDAELGYTRGAGAIYSGEWTPLQGQTVEARVAIVAAVQNGTGVVVECLGNQITESGALHPDPSSLAGDSWCDQTSNTIMWRGQKPL